jgi:hypothetical protein
VMTFQGGQVKFPLGKKIYWLGKEGGERLHLTLLNFYRYCNLPPKLKTLNLVYRTLKNLESHPIALGFRVKLVG